MENGHLALRQCKLNIPLMIMGLHFLKIGALRVGRLDKHLTRALGPTRSPAHLSNRLIEPLLRSEVKAVEATIDIEDSNQGYSWKIVSL